MKNLAIHGIYLTLIGFLAFQLYSTTKARDLALGQVEKILQKDFQVIEGTCQYMFNEIEKRYAAYAPQRFSLLFDNARNVYEESSRLMRLLDKNIGQIEVANLSEIKDSIQGFTKKIRDIDDKKDLELVSKHYDLGNLITNDSFQSIFKSE